MKWSTVMFCWSAAFAGEACYFAVHDYWQGAFWVSLFSLAYFWAGVGTRGIKL